MKKWFGRREFLKGVGGTALGAAAFSFAHSALGEASGLVSTFKSDWPKDARRPWPGPEYWTNPLQDWRITNGRLECFSPGGDRNVTLLTRAVSTRLGSLHLAVRLGQVRAVPLKDGFAGFRVGIKHPTNDYRAMAIYGRGMNCGIHADGRLFIGSLEADAPKVDAARPALLTLDAEPSGDVYNVTLRATGEDGAHAVRVSRQVPPEWLAGMLALVSSSAPLLPSPVKIPPVEDGSFYPPHQEAGGTMRFWFEDWIVAGSKVDEHDDRAFGPILFTLYTVSRGVLKLSAQFPPLGNTAETATLEVRSEGGEWKAVGSGRPTADAWNVTFRVAAWDAGVDREYRVIYPWRGGHQEYHGTIRKDPAGREDFRIGLLTCLWDLGFPHSDLVKNIGWHKPDLLLWTGDQVYEPVGGFGVIESRAPDMIEPAMEDFLRKWFIFGWATRELNRDTPAVCMTDDHDMYQGNIWGCGGRPTNPASSYSAAIRADPGALDTAQDDSGGYKMSARWVNMVQKLQTAHLPDPYDPAPVLQHISVYYTDLLWGGISFAILEDRKWKSSPTVMLPRAKIVNGFPTNLSWNSVESNVPDAQMLGVRQLDFLEAWAGNWSGGVWMKFAVTQTLFGCLHTEPKGSYNDDDELELAVPPVGVYVKGDHMVADHDSGGWPQHSRDAAIRIWRKAFAAHLNGDQHLGTTSHYGVEKFRDGVYGICTPALTSIWPRRWWPSKPAPNALPGKQNTGDYFDAFGNRMTVLAVANPARYPGTESKTMRYRATGYTILTVNRATHGTVIAQWPRWVDPSAPDAKPYEGWPIAMRQIDNGLWGAEWELDRVETPGFRDAVVQVQREPEGDILYTLRIAGESFLPLVREAGTYTILAYDPDGDYRKVWKSVPARRRKSEV